MEVKYALTIRAAQLVNDRGATVKMARASDKDREAVKDFLSLMECIAFYGSADVDDKEWKPSDGELGEWVRDWFQHHSPAMNRVVWGFDTLVRNCCDPEADVLEWRPDIKAALEAAGLEKTA